MRTARVEVDDDLAGAVIGLFSRRRRRAAIRLWRDTLYRIALTWPLWRTGTWLLKRIIHLI